MTTRTAAQRRADARDVYLREFADCPMNRVLSRLGDKWSAVIFRQLGEGRKRHGELARGVAGATQKMLTQTLRSLERDGLVSRSVVATVPPQVSYELTPLGRSLAQVLEQVKVWSDPNAEKMDAAEAHYDSDYPQ